MKHKNEEPLPNHSGAKAERIDLGLAIFSAVAKPRAPYSAAEIAGWCECTPARISAIEHRALRRLRMRLRTDPTFSQAEMREAVQMFDGVGRS